jgi:hypothetical protein
VLPSIRPAAITTHASRSSRAERSVPLVCLLEVQILWESREEISIRQAGRLVCLTRVATRPFYPTPATPAVDHEMDLAIVPVAMLVHRKINYGDVEMSLIYAKRTFVKL